jgi:hypothetical protein
MERDAATIRRQEIYVLWVFGGIALLVIGGLVWSVLFHHG